MIYLLEILLHRFHQKRMARRLLKTTGASIHQQILQPHRALPNIAAAEPLLPTKEVVLLQPAVATPLWSPADSTMIDIRQMLQVGVSGVEAAVGPYMDTPMKHFISEVKNNPDHDS